MSSLKLGFHQNIEEIRQDQTALPPYYRCMVKHSEELTVHV